MGTEEDTPRLLLPRAAGRAFVPEGTRRRTASHALASIAHMKEGKVRWRFVATEVNTEFREDDHQGTPPLMIVRAAISRAGSCPT